MLSDSILNRVFATPISLVRMITRNDTYALMFEGEGGLGKTHTILKTLADEGHEYNKDYVYLRGYSTPLAFYMALYEHRDKKEIVLDDMEGIFKDDRGKAILKACLDKKNGKRSVSYITTDERIKNTPKEFEITANIILCANDYPEDADFRALQDRCIYYKFEFTYAQKIEMMNEIIKQPYKNLTEDDRKYVMDFIINYTTEATKNFSLRLLFKLMDIYTFDKQNFRKIAQEILEEDEILSILAECIKSHEKVIDQTKEFQARTGIRPRQFFNLRKKLR